MLDSRSSLFQGSTLDQWLLQKEGWEVNPRGHLSVYDRGIDLIATRGDKVRYIQCKGWGLRAKIHENVVDQLLGSVVYQVGGIENVGNVEVCIYTSSEATPYALDHAQKLKVQIIQKRFPNWNRKKKIY